MARSFVSGSSQYASYAGAVVAAMPFTLSVWCKTSTLTGTLVPFGLASTASNNPIALIRIRGELTDDPLELLYRDDANTSGGSVVTSGAGTGMPSATWTLITAVFASTTSRSLYKNGGGKVSGTTSIAGSFTPDRTGMAAIVRATASSFSTLELAHCAVWNKALSDAEVASLWVSAETGIYPNEVASGNCVAYWPLVGTDSPEPDDVASFDMTLTNTPTQSTGPTMQSLPSSGQASLVGGQLFRSPLVNGRLAS